jgi:hypothetical protein
MEYAPYLMSTGEVPHNSTFDQLGPTQTAKILRNTSDHIYITVGCGTYMKFKKVDSPDFQHDPMVLFEACTKKGAVEIGSKYILVRKIVRKLVSFHSQLLELDENGTATLQCNGSLSGDMLCSVQIKPYFVTVSALNAAVKEELVKQGLLSKQGVVKFTDEFIVYTKPGVKVSNSFKVVGDEKKAKRIKTK